MLKPFCEQGETYVDLTFLWHFLFSRFAAEEMEAE